MRTQTTSKPSKIAIISIAVCVVLAGVAALFYLKSDANPAGGKDGAAAAQPTLTVATAAPESLSLPITLSANGALAAWQEAIVSTESNGLQLVQVLANVGDRVKAGQVLAVFSAQSVQTDVAQAQASVLEAQASAEDAAQTAARARTLDNVGALSAQQISQFNTADKAAQARLAAARAGLQAQQLRSQQTRVLAPDDGVISARSATVGAVVGAGTELFRLIRGGRLEWRAEVTAAELGRLKVGAPAHIVAASGARATGRVRIVAPSVDAQTRTALVYVDLPAAAPGTPALLAGMFAQGTFELGSSPALTVPQAAVVLRDGFSYVFSVNPAEPPATPVQAQTSSDAAQAYPQLRVRELKVQTGRTVGERIEIVSGLDSGTAVVVQGAGFIHDGDLVRVNNAASPAAASSAASGASVPEAPYTASKSPVSGVQSTPAAIK